MKNALKNNSFRIIGIIVILLVSSSCSKFLDVTLRDLLSNNPSTPQSEQTLVIQSGVVEKALDFPVENESSLLNYTIECAFKINASSAEAPCVSYGDNAPTVDSNSKKFVWDVSANTPQGIYSFIVKKNFTDKTLTCNFSMQVDFRAPFISKFALNPDKLFTIKLDNNLVYNFVIDWGDSTPPETITSPGTISHQYTGPATEVTIKITGELPAFKATVIDPTDRVALITFVAPIVGVDYATAVTIFASYTTSQLYDLLLMAGISPVQSAFNSKIIDIINFGELGLKSLDYAFSGQSLLAHVGPGDLSSVTSMDSAFANSGFPSQIVFDTTGWKLDNVVSAKSAFSGIIFNASSDLSGITFSSKLKDATLMLSRAKGDFTTAASWNLSGLTNMSAFFKNAELTNLNTTIWNMQNIETFESTFDSFKCTTCNFSGIHLTNKTLNTDNMFLYYAGTSPLTLGTFDMSEVQTSKMMFANVDFTLFPNWSQIIVSNKNKNISGMFKYSKNLSLETSAWNTNNVEDFSELFYDVDMANVNTSGIQVTAKATNLASMFRQAENLVLDTSSWNTNNVQDFTSMFSWADPMTSINTSGVRVTANATNISFMYSFTKSLTVNTNLPGKEWDTSSILNMDSLFNYATCETNVSCDFSKVIPTNKVKSLNYTFAASATQTIDGMLGSYWTSNSKFPPIDTSLWDTSNVESFSGTFHRTNLAGSNLSGITVTSKVKSIESMFDGAQNVVLNTSAWDVSNLISAVSAFSELDASAINFAGFIPKGDVSLVETFGGIRNATIDTGSWLLNSAADVNQIFSSGYNNIIYLNNLNLNTQTNGVRAFSNIPSSYGTRIVVGATTTDPGALVAPSYLSNTNIWCPDYPGATFQGFTCQKTPFVP